LLSKNACGGDAYALPADKKLSQAIQLMLYREEVSE
jgi:hypothetical protein